MSIKNNIPEDHSKIKQNKQSTIGIDTKVSGGVIDIINEAKTIDHLFYLNQKGAHLDFGDQNRLGIEAIANKNDIFKGDENLGTILHHALKNKNEIIERQNLLSYLNTHKDTPEISKIYDKVMNHGNFYLKEYDDKTDQYLCQKYLKETSLEAIQTDILEQKEGIPEELYGLQQFIMELKNLGNELVKVFSDNPYLIHQKHVFDGILREYGLDRNFSEILKNIETDEDYFRKIGSKNTSLFKTCKRFGTLLKLVSIIQDFQLNKVSFDSTSAVSYTDGFSPFETLENNILADAIPDTPVVIFRAPNGIGKSFYEEKEMYINILAQSLGFTTAQNANLRIYDEIYFMNRMQSYGINDDLSALGKEGKKLDELYDTLRKSTGNVLVYLDETGSTTDEKNEFEIVSSFLDAVQQLPNTENIRIRLSTHNQKIIDYYKGNNDLPIYTFDDDRSLYEGERDSDSLNTYKKICVFLENILTKIESGSITLHSFEDWSSSNKIIENLYREKYSEGENIQASAMKSFFSNISSQEQEKNTQKQLTYVTQVVRDFISVGNEIENNIELFLHGTPTQYSLPEYHNTPMNKKLSYDTSELDLIRNDMKGFDVSLWISGREDFNDLCIHHHQNMHDELVPHRLTGKYELQYHLDGGGSRTETSIDRLYDYYHLGISNQKNYDTKAINNFPLLKERQDFITHLIQNPEIGKKMIAKSEPLKTFLWSFDSIMNDFYYHYEIDYENNKLKYDYTKTINLYTYVLDRILFKNKKEEELSEVGHILDSKQPLPREIMEIFQVLQVYCIFFNINITDLGIEDDMIYQIQSIFDTTKLKEENIRSAIFRNDKYKLLEMSQSEISTTKNMQTILQKIFAKKIPKIIADKSIDLPTLLAQDIDFESYNLDQDIKNHELNKLKWFYSIYNDTQYISDLLNTIRQINTPLGNGISNYFEQILKFVFGNIENGKDLIQYIEKFPEIYQPQGYSYGKSYGLNKEEKRIVSIEKNDGINNLLSAKRHGYEVAIGENFSTFERIIEKSNWYRKNNYAKVEFTQNRELNITGIGKNNSDDDYVSNNVSLNAENPIEIINGFNSSGKTEYIRSIRNTIESALSDGYVNAESMTIGGIDNFAYIDRIVTDNNSLSSGQQDMMYWTNLLTEIKDKDFIIVNVDEIFTTMDKKFSTAFAYTFVGKLLEMGKLAIIVSHNHEFVELFSKIKGVKCSKFDSRINEDGDVQHTYQKIPGTIIDSAGVQVIKTLGYGKGWLYK